MTQDRYMTRGRIHTQVADLMDRTVRINDEKTMSHTACDEKIALKWGGRGSNPRPTDYESSASAHACSYGLLRADRAAGTRLSRGTGRDVRS
jgi:hypothetical protein